MNTQSITLDVSKEPSVAQVVRIGQGDVSGTTIAAAIYDNGTALDLTSYTAKFEMRLPYGAGYVEDENCTVSGNVITYVVDEEHCASTAGKTECAYFDVMDGDELVCSTQRFSIVVLRDASDGVDPASAWTNGIEEWLDDAQATLNNAVSTAQSDVADAISDAQSDVAEAVEDATDATECAEAAIEAIGDISELAVPLMSADTRGGAKLGAGLAVTDGALGSMSYMTTETVGGDRVLTLVYDLVEE